MRPALLLSALCVSVLHLSSPAAMSAEKVTGQLALTGASSGCPAGTMSQAVVAVKLVLPPAGDVPARPVNRFRYNYAAPASNPVISGEIHDAGRPGCTLSFAGPAISYD